VTPLNIQIGWEVWWARHWAKKFGYRVDIVSIATRYGISRQQVSAHANKVGKAMDIVLQRYGGDADTMFRSCLAELGQSTDDHPVLAEVCTETGEIVTGRNRWEKAASALTYSDDDPGHPAHKAFYLARHEAAQELVRLGKKRTRLETELLTVRDREKRLSSIVTLSRSSGRTKKTP
jgi:hypothetical protein